VELHFCDSLRLGDLGVACATIITYFLNLSLITIYFLVEKDVRKSFFFFTRKSFKDISSYLKIGIPSLIMLCLEWWSFEVLAIMAGYISLEATAAHVIVLNTFVILIMAPLGA
jgi:MATE family multidrug resistance protein